MKYITIESVKPNMVLKLNTLPGGGQFLVRSVSESGNYVTLISDTHTLKMLRGSDVFLLFTYWSHTL